MIGTFFNTTAINLRRSTASPTGTDVLTTVSSFACLLRPISDVSSLYQQNNIGREFDAVAGPTVDVNVGDDFISGGVKYKVLGSSVYTDLEDNTDSYTNIRIVK